MNVVISSQLLRGGRVQPKVQTNSLRCFLHTWPSSNNTVKNRCISLINLSSSRVMDLNHSNCRKYKNFGHEREPPPPAGLKLHRLYCMILPVLFFLDWKWLFYKYKPDWYARIRKYDAKGQDISVYERDLERPFPHYPGK